MKKRYNDPPSGRVPLERRLRRLKLGLVSDEKVLNARLSRMRSIPLTTWFEECPQQLEQLCGSVPAIRRHMTFGAAGAVLWDGRSTPQGLENMWLLLTPLLDIDRRMVKQNDGSACYWGTR